MADATPETSVPAEPGGRGSGSHLSIGEVLALLLEEFPDVTISKIRFLESQGLIEPERTASGYRKFYDVDVELLRCILREQKDNFLPLKVIKDRLDTGEIDPTSEVPRPAGIRNLPDDTDAQSLAESRRGHPAAQFPRPGLFDRTDGDTDVTRPGGMARPGIDPSSPTGRGGAPATGRGHGSTRSSGDDTAGIPLRAGVVLDAAELCSMASLTVAQLEQLQSYGLIVADANKRFDEDALEIARIAKRFLDLGVDARHLRGWRVAADREAGLFEQMIQPLLRQRNPQSSEHALAQLTELEQFGAQLRSALMRTLLRQHFDR